MAATVEPVTVTSPDLEARRAAGAARLAATGYPTTRDEEWRFTPVQPVTHGTWADAAPAAVAPAALEPFLFGHADWSVLVFVNGHYAPALSQVRQPADVTVSTLAEALAAGNPVAHRHALAHAPVERSAFVAENAARSADGGFVHVAAGADVALPVHLVHVASPEAAGTVKFPRTLVVVERGARLNLVESYVALPGAERYVTNAVTEVVTGANAWVEHTRLQRESEAGYHIGWTQVTQERDSHYRNFTLAAGGQLSRHDLTVRLGGPNAETLMYGLYLGRHEQLHDNHTTIHHDHPDCRSWEVYKGILADRARGVFNGKIFVDPIAQKTDAKQTNRALLLSPDAKVDTKPQLEIFADDVKCTHGATIGYLDPMPLFYGRSRGIPREAAHRMLTYAFCCEVTDEIRLGPVRTELERLVRERVGLLA
ncbi:MAG: Fe-S cluster assembly protein SufD [Gemmatimonadales bacterium]|nr:Fe-S cluster assembly protein SufD [Gemmatimonadales bacterium]